MKRKYTTASVRYIDLISEGVIATSSKDSFGVYSDEEVETDVILTEKKNLWDRNGVWK